jgi:hypothetical protein
MINATRKARPRRSANRVKLVEPDGSAARPPAESWPGWTDGHFWEPTRDHVIGTDSMGADVHESDCVPEPDETDAEWIGRLEEQEAAEKARVLTTYQPSPTDLAEYSAWSRALDAGTLPPAISDHFRFGEYHALSTGQVSETELAMIAAGMAL